MTYRFLFLYCNRIRAATVIGYGPHKYVASILQVFDEYVARCVHQKPFWVIKMLHFSREKSPTREYSGDESHLQAILLDNMPNCLALILKKSTHEIAASNRLARKSGAVPGEVCFKTIAERKDRCPFCQTPKLWSTGKAQQLEVALNGTWYDGIWIPFTEDLYIHYLFDITSRKLTEQTLGKVHEESERRMRKRIADLSEANNVLREEVTEQKTAFKVLLNQRDEYTTEIEERMISNIGILAEPLIAKLKKTGLNGLQKAIVEIIESNLKEVTSPFALNLSEGLTALTPKEIQIATLIKHGKSTKDIAEVMGVSKRTVDTHRLNIRAKLGIKKNSVTLRSYLASMDL